MLKVFKKIFFVGLLTILCLPLVAVAAVEIDPTKVLENAGKTGGYNTTEAAAEDLTSRIGRIVQYLLSFVGIACLLVIIYAGWLWLSAGGNEEQITKAKELIKNGLIGLALVLSTGVIVYIALQFLGGLL